MLDSASLLLVGIVIGAAVANIEWLILSYLKEKRLHARIT